MKTQPVISLFETICSELLPIRSLSGYRLLAISFLCDWKHAIEYERPITSCKWSILKNNVSSEDAERELLEWDKIERPASGIKENIIARSSMRWRFLQFSTETEVCRHVISAIGHMSDFNIERIVISTYPYKIRGDLNLSQLAIEYRNLYGKEYIKRASA